MYHIDFAKGHDGQVEVNQDATSRRGVRDYNHVRTGHYTNIIDIYTTKTLTYPADILRACSGVLHNLYGSRIVHGLPWGDFDRSLLWYAEEGLRNHISALPHDVDIFPSWSWISVSGNKCFHRTRAEGYSTA